MVNLVDLIKLIVKKDQEDNRIIKRWGKLAGFLPYKRVNQHLGDDFHLKKVIQSNGCTAGDEIMQGYCYCMNDEVVPGSAYAVILKAGGRYYNAREVYSNR